MACQFCEHHEDDLLGSVDERDLQDLLVALLDRDLSMALIYARRVFPGVRAQGVCERVINQAKQRRAA